MDVSPIYVNFRICLQLEFLVNMPPELLSQVFEEMRAKCSSSSSSASVSIPPPQIRVAASTTWWKPMSAPSRSSGDHARATNMQTRVVAQNSANNDTEKWIPEPISDIITALKTWVAHSTLSNSPNEFPTDAQIKMLVDFGQHLILSKQGDQVSVKSKQ